MATLQSLRDDVRSHIDEALPQFWEPAEIDRWIGEALRDVARRGEVLQAHKSYAVIGNQLTYPAPPDMLRIYRVEYRQTSSYIVALQFVTLAELDDYSGMSREVPGSIPQFWSYWGYPGGPDAQIYLFPVPSATIGDGLRVYYYRLPKQPTDPDEQVDIPAGWEDLVPLYVETVCLRKARDPRYQEAAQLYEARLQQMIETTRQASDQLTHWSAQSVANRWPWIVSEWDA